MVGKLDLDLGEDYAFDIRRARYVAERNPDPAGPDPLPIGGVDGPNASLHGRPYWLQRNPNNVWYVWFDVDTDPDPDLAVRLKRFLRDANVDINYRNDVRNRAEELGWAG